MSTNYATSTDLTFITNERGQSLKDRFRVLIKDTKLFDCLIGFFNSSGFYRIYEPLENTEKIRILIGISISRQTFDSMTKKNRSRRCNSLMPRNKKNTDYNLGLTEEEIRIVEGEV